MSERRPPAFWIYTALAVIGLVGTAYFNVKGMVEPQGSLASAWFGTPAASSLAIDLLVTASAASIFIIIEGRRLGIRWYWLYVVASFVTAVGFTFPLFLAARELRMARTATPPVP